MTITIKHFCIGSVLPNGATVLEIRDKKMKALGNDYTGRVVLCKHGGEYVTWVIDKEGHAFWGHYFPQLSKAAEDFETR